ncbi:MULTISPECIES: multidrug efflux SMR transporter [Ralstonia]|uniref:DMT family transporter n=1 Tax=Ralstonia TaxID=48736 RepID=UPI0011AFAF85|nr:MULTISPECIES: multidrug efflux SMR transporter [Ralstonia]
MNPWLLLAGTIVTEVIGTLCLRLSEGFSKPAWIIGTAVCYGLAFWGLAIVMKRIDMSITYAVWSGVGTVLTAIVGILLFKEGVSTAKLSGIGMVVGGVVLLNMSGASH